MKYRITIPQPCHEDWNQMTPTERGKFCAVCQKEVLDFTHLTDKELVQRLDTGKKMCGRFRENQLNVDFHSMETPSVPMKKWWLGAASVLSLGIAGQAQVEQDSVKTVQLNENFTERKITKDSVITVRGKVIDEFGPIPNSNIQHFSKSHDNFFKNDVTNENGEFEIKVFSDERITFITPDLISKEYCVSDLNKDAINTIDFSDYTVLTEQVVVGMPFVSMKCKPNLWQRFTNIFRSRENRRCATRNH